MFNALSNVMGYLNAEGYCNADKCHVSACLAQSLCVLLYRAARTSLQPHLSLSSDMHVLSGCRM